MIDQNNEQVGIMASIEALDLARDVGLDLVEVSPNSTPPVCRVMDFGKMQYDQKKKDHKAKQKQHLVVLKEVRLRPKIDTHDRDFKMKRARQFLEKGSKVQFTMLFRGREMAHLDRAMAIFDGIVEELKDIGKVEMPARQQGRRATMTMAALEVKQP